MSSSGTEEPSILDKIDSVVPAPLAKFDAFPKLPSTYKSRSESRGFMTVFVALLALLLMLNDVGEYIWGWRDEEFSIDANTSSYLSINVDVSVAMPCKCECLFLLGRVTIVPETSETDLSVDLRDAVGDRLMLSGGLHRDGVCQF
jgi:endoplasmic reticulum-Golgi intermediate compartment protein 2